jgi:hypothetical protein
MAGCGVAGCLELTIVGRRHRIYGNGDYCQGHDPDRHGYAKPFYVPARDSAPSQEHGSTHNGLTNDELVSQMLREVFRLLGRETV